MYQYIESLLRYIERMYQYIEPSPRCHRRSCRPNALALGDLHMPKGQQLGRMLYAMRLSMLEFRS
jgi:hypothetical protein